MSLSLGEIDADEENDWSIDIGSAHLQCQEMVPFYQLQCKLIVECTDVDEFTWIRLYAKKFREIISSDHTLTASQIKRMLYVSESIYK